MMRTSIRMRLTLWNTGTLMLALLVFAGVVHGTVRTMLLRSVDRDLASEAGAATQDFPSRARVLQKVSPSQSSGAIIKSERPVKYGVSTLLIALAAKTSQIGASSAPPKAVQTVEIPKVELPKAARASEIAKVPDFAKNPDFAKFLSGNWDAMILAPSARHKQIAVYIGSGLTSASGKRWPASEGYATLTDNGQPLRVFSKPIRDTSGKATGFVQATYSLIEINTLLRGLDWTLLILIPPALLGAGLGGAFLTGRALRPIAQISQAAAALEASDLSQRLPVTGRDEFARLSTTFNGLFGRLETTFVRLENAVAQQKRFTADASHELRTPLTTIKSYADWARRRPRSPGEYLEALTAVETAADRMTRIVKDLLQMAQTDHGGLACSLEEVSMPELLACVRESLPARAAGPRLSFTTEPPNLRCQGDSHLLERLLTNLIDNAVRHTPASGVVGIRAEEGPDGSVALTVEDDGEGIPAEHLPHVCERFYRVDAARTRARGGTGLGLAICQGIADAHGGQLSVESTVGQGTHVTFTLPAACSPGSP